jgi:hypothetical protein
MPPERGRVVRKLGVNPRSLREMVERNEIVGRERLAARRAAHAAESKQDTMTWAPGASRRLPACGWSTRATRERG